MNLPELSPHRRYDPLRDKWVLVSPQRDQRPWQGQEESTKEQEPAYVSDCYLCPGNTRAEGAINPDYKDVYAFDNDFPALHSHKRVSDEQLEADQDPLFAKQAVEGRCRVICYSPRHNETLSTMEQSAIVRVIDVWADEITELSKDFEHVQVFENRGATMGCSNPHPHGQIWALGTQPSEVAIESCQQSAYFTKHHRPLLLDYAHKEHADGARTVFASADWIIVVPWWATWPFETLVLPLFTVSHLPELTSDQRRSLAEALKELLTRYDLLFATSFPYSMGWHGRPKSEAVGPWQLHAHFYPPLLRSATVRKHMVGFEMLGESQRDITPERAAKQLRSIA